MQTDTVIMPFILDKSQIDFFQNEGYIEIKNLLSDLEVEQYSNIYNDFLSNKINAVKYWVDLAGITDKPDTSDKIEAITQIMFPSRLMPSLMENVLHQRATSIAKKLLGKDMELDIDMLIDKAPHTNTPTDWHQDSAYWMNIPDVRALTCWVALDDAGKENGCLWYVPKSHRLPPRLHRLSGKLLHLVCDANEEEAILMKIKKGSCILHHGGTIHYSRGNSTDSHRRAFVMNFRPGEMIDYTILKGYDHPGEKFKKIDKITKIYNIIGVFLILVFTYVSIIKKNL
jgi:ectoine hydroxylase-related dioxygenase (phytanoyl-CoA dioxygenase family)